NKSVVEDCLRRDGSKTIVTNFDPESRDEREIEATASGLQASVNATPTRKVVSQWEKDVDDIEGTALEQQRIQERLGDVTAQANAIQAKIRETEQSSSEEQTLLETYMNLTNEKNHLVGRQEYYNIIENIRETSRHIADLNEQLDNMTKSTPDGKLCFFPTFFERSFGSSDPLLPCRSKF
ncbi:hypothetical protein COOONC_25310, partial [Cooperia oncophora]